MSVGTEIRLSVQLPVGAVAGEGAVHDTGSTGEGCKVRAEPYQTSRGALKDQLLLAFYLHVTPICGLNRQEEWLLFETYMY